MECQSFVCCNYVDYLLVNNKVDKNIQMSIYTSKYQIYITTYFINRFKDIYNFLGYKYTSRS